MFMLCARSISLPVGTRVSRRCFFVKILRVRAMKRRFRQIFPGGTKRTSENCLEPVMNAVTWRLDPYLRTFVSRKNLNRILLDGDHAMQPADDPAGARSLFRDSIPAAQKLNTGLSRRSPFLRLVPAVRECLKLNESIFNSHRCRSAWRRRL